MDPAYFTNVNWENPPPIRAINPKYRRFKNQVVSYSEKITSQPRIRKTEIAEPLMHEAIDFANVLVNSESKKSKDRLWALREEEDKPITDALVEAADLIDIVFQNEGTSSLPACYPTTSVYQGVDLRWELAENFSFELIGPSPSKAKWALYVRIEGQSTLEEMHDFDQIRYELAKLLQIRKQ